MIPGQDVYQASKQNKNAGVLSYFLYSGENICMYYERCLSPAKYIFSCGGHNKPDLFVPGDDRCIQSCDLLSL